MRKKMIWAAVALVLIAAPAVIGIAVIGSGDDGSSDARRAGALLDPKAADSAAASLVPVGLVIPGPAQAIDVMSYQFGVANATAAAAGAAGAGKANFSELTISKSADVSSPVLMKACATGQHLPTVTLNLRKTGGAGAKQPYLIVKMTDVVISSYQVSGSGSDAPSESVSLNFAKIEFSYADQKADGSPGGPTSQFVYDLKLAKS